MNNNFNVYKGITPRSDGTTKQKYNEKPSLLTGDENKKLNNYPSQLTTRYPINQQEQTQPKEAQLPPSAIEIFSNVEDTIGHLGDQLAYAGLKGVEGIMDSVLGLGGTIAEIFGADTSRLENFISTDWSKEAMNNEIFSAVWHAPETLKRLVTHAIDDDAEIVRTTDERKEDSYIDDMGGAGDFLSQTAYSIGMMLPTIALSKVSAAAGVGTKVARLISMTSFGAGAAGTRIEEELQKGETLARATGKGAISGAIEVGTELIGGEWTNKILGFGGQTLLSKLGGQTGVTKMISKIAKNNRNFQVALKLLANMNAEGVEEIIGNYLDPLIEVVFDKQKYQAPTIDENLMSYCCAAFSSFVMAGASTSVRGVDSVKADLVQEDMKNTLKNYRQIENKSEQDTKAFTDAINKYKTEMEGYLSKLTLEQRTNYFKQNIAGKNNLFIDFDIDNGKVNQTSWDTYTKVNKVINNYKGEMTSEKQSFVEGITNLEKRANSLNGLNTDIILEDNASIQQQTNVKNVYVDGFYSDEKGLHINMDAVKDLNKVYVHELVHSGEFTKGYAKLVEKLIPKEEFETIKKEIESKYSKAIGDVDDYTIYTETIANILEEKLGNKEFVNQLYVRNKGLFNKIRSLFDSKETKQTRKIAELLEEAVESHKYKDYQKPNVEEKNSFKEKESTKEETTNQEKDSKNQYSISDNDQTLTENLLENDTFEPVIDELINIDTKAPKKLTDAISLYVLNKTKADESLLPEIKEQVQEKLDNVIKNNKEKIKTISKQAKEVYDTKLKEEIKKHSVELANLRKQRDQKLDGLKFQMEAKRNALLDKNNKVIDEINKKRIDEKEKHKQIIDANNELIAEQKKLLQEERKQKLEILSSYGDIAEKSQKAISTLTKKYNALDDAFKNYTDIAKQTIAGLKYIIQYSAKIYKLQDKIKEMTTRTYTDAGGTTLQAQAVALLDTFKGYGKSKQGISFVARRGIAKLSDLYTEENCTKNQIDFDQNIRDCIDYILSNATAIAKRGINKGNQIENRKPLSPEELVYLHAIMQYTVNLADNFKNEYRQGQIQNLDENAVDTATNSIKVKPIITDNTFKNKVNDYFLGFATNNRVYFNRLVGYNRESMLYQHIEDIKRGETFKYKKMLEYYKPIQEFYKKHKNFISKARHTAVEINGVEISRLQLISLYQYTKREQALSHLEGGGFSFTNKKGQKIQSGEVNLSTEIIEKMLTEEELEYVEVIDGVLKSTTGDIIQADAENKGYTLIVDKDAFYIPIYTDNMSNYKRFAQGLKSATLPHDYGFTKVIKKNASNTIKLTDIDKIMSRYLDEATNYMGYEHPIQNLTRLINRRVYMKDSGEIISKTEMDNRRAKLKELKKENEKWLKIEKKYMDWEKQVEEGKLSPEICQQLIEANPLEGLSTNDYNKEVAKIDIDYKPIEIRKLLEQIDPKFFKRIDSWISDILSNGDFENSERVLRFIKKNFAKFQLGANVKVFVTQTASIANAAPYVGWNNLIKAHGKFFNVYFGKNTRQEMFKYSPYVEFRNTNSGIVLAETGLGLGTLDKATDILTKPTQLFDDKTIQLVWVACKYNIAEKYSVKDISNLTEEQLQEAGQLLEQTVRASQPNFNASEKSTFGRQKGLLSLITMFTTQPIQSLSQLVDSISEVNYLKKNGGPKTNIKKAMNNARGTGAAIAMSIVIYSLMAELFKQFTKKRDEEDDETIAQSSAKQMLDSIAGMFPVFKDIYGLIASDYESTNFVTGAFDSVKDVADFFKTIPTGDISPAERRKAIYGVCQLLGIPARNIYKYTNATIDKFDAGAAIQYSSLFYDKSVSNYATAISNSYKKNQMGNVTSLTKAFFDNRGIESNDYTTNSYIGKLIAEGYNFDPKQVKDIISYEGEEFQLSNAQQKKFKYLYSQVSKEARLLVNNTYFKNSLTKEEQVKALKYLYDAYYEYALSNTLSVSNRNKIARIIGHSSSYKLIVALAKTNSFKSTKTNTKKQQIFRFVNSNSLSLTQYEKYILLGLSGYKSKNAYLFVKNYLKLKGVNSNDSNAILDIVSPS